jgi:HK97 family phage prohead protease
MERRYQEAIHPEFRDAQDGKPPCIFGHVAQFNSWSPTYYGLREQIDPGFFDDVLGGDVVSCQNHDPNFVLGRTTSVPVSLRLAKTDKGLYTETDLIAKTSYAADALENLRTKNIRGASFAFSMPMRGDQGWPGDRIVEEQDGTISRTLLRASALHDVSPVVTYPYYPQTEMGVRAMQEARAALIERRGAEAGDVRVLADEALLRILADPKARALSPKEVMLVAAAIGLLEELVPDDDDDDDEEDAQPDAGMPPIAGSPTMYSLFARKRKVLRALTWTNLPYKKSAVSDKTTWDGPAEVKKSEAGDLKHMCIGYVGDGTAKGDYAGPHHENAPGYPVNKPGLIACRARLNQIKGADTSAGEAHLKKHYADCDMKWDDDEKAAPEVAPELLVVAPAYLSLRTRLAIAERTL